MSERTCWSCQHQQIGGDSFLGLCLYFVALGKEKKPIPGHIVDVGCKFWIGRQET